MKNQVRNIVLSIGISTLLGGVSLLAQDPNREYAKIPFAFHASQSSLPAGDYVVVAGGNGTLKLQTAGKAVVMITIPEATGNNDTPKLVFHRIGDQYFLSQVWMPSGRKVLHKDRLERELEVGGKEVAMVYVPIERQ